MDATERERLAALAEHRDDMTDRNGQPCYLRFTGASDSHEWATGKAFRTARRRPVSTAAQPVHQRGRRGAYMRGC